KMSAAFGWAPMAHVEGDRESRLAEAERRQRILSEVSRVLLDYVGPDEIEPLRRTVHEVTEATGTDWCAFALVQPDGKLKNVATYHPDPRQRELEKKLNDLLPPKPWDAGLAERNARLVAQIARERDRQILERAEAERRFAELRAVFDWDPNGIALFDAGGALRLASHRIEEIFGIPLRAMYGQRFDDIYRQKVGQAVTQEPEAMLERVRAIFANRDAASRDEIELERPTHRWLTRNTTPVRGPGGEYLGRLVVYTDVTEQRELDRQRSDFLTVAAHELRTPLTPLSMYLQSIERRVKRSQAVGNDLVTKARRQVERLGRLVEDLLDVSRLESRRLHLSSSDVEINDLVDDVVADFRAQTRSHDIRFHRAGAPVLVEGDRERLEQVLVNLMTN